MFFSKAFILGALAAGILAIPVQNEASALLARDVPPPDEFGSWEGDGADEFGPWTKREAEPHHTDAQIAAKKKAGAAKKGKKGAAKKGAAKKGAAKKKGAKKGAAKKGKKAARDAEPEPDAEPEAEAEAEADAEPEAHHTDAQIAAKKAAAGKKGHKHH